MNGGISILLYINIENYKLIQYVPNVRTQEKCIKIRAPKISKMKTNY